MKHNTRRRPGPNTTARGRMAAVSKVRDDGRTVDDVALKYGVDPNTLRRWIKHVAGAAGGPIKAAALADRPRSGRPPTAWSGEGAEAAYRLWRKLYMCPEAPSVTSCLRRVQDVGAVRGWKLPSKSAFLRRLRATTPPVEIALARSCTMELNDAQLHQVVNLAKGELTRVVNQGQMIAVVVPIRQLHHLLAGRAARRPGRPARYPGQLKLF